MFYLLDIMEEYDDDYNFYSRNYEENLIGSKQLELKEQIFRLYYYRSLPVLAAGMLIWIFSTLSIDSILFLFTTGGLIISYIGYFVLWILTYVFAIKKMNTASMLSFFGASYLNGVIQSPIILWVCLQMPEI